MDAADQRGKLSGRNGVLGHEGRHEIGRQFDVIRWGLLFAHPSGPFLFRCSLTDRASPDLLFSRGPLSDTMGYIFASSKMPIQGRTSGVLSRGPHEYPDLCDIVLLTLVYRYAACISLVLSSFEL